MASGEILQRGLSTGQRAIVSGASAAVLIVLFAAPFGHAVTGSDDVFALGLGSGLAVGVGIAMLRAHAGGVIPGVLCGMVTAVAALLVGAYLPATGVGVLLPPVIAAALASVDVFGRTLVGWGRSTLIGCAIGTCIGIAIGLTTNYGLLAVAGGVVLGALAGIYIAMRRDPERGFLGGVRRPPLPALLFIGALLILVWSVIRFYDRNSLMTATLGSIGSIIVGPLVVLVGTHLGLSWLRDRVRIFRRLTPFFRIMWAPMSAFAIGYLAIIVVFAGFFGAIDRLGGERTMFTGTDASTTIVDWLFFAFFNATAQDYNAIMPASDLARLVVGAQLVVTVAWAVVVFAAVMASVQPQLEAAARGDAGDPPPNPPGA